jgi:integrase
VATAADTLAVKHESARERLTDKRIEKLTARPGKRIEIADTIVRELRLRVSDKGAKTWSVLYRVAGAAPGGLRGPMKRLTLGSYPLVLLEKARDKARDALDAADRGMDPAELRTAQVEDQRTRTFEAVMERFIELHAKQNTKEGRHAAAQVKQALERAGQDTAEAAPRGAKGKLGRCPAERYLADYALPHWHGRLIDTIRRAEAHELLDRVSMERGAPAAREVRKHLASMFNWAVDRGMLHFNPVAGMKRGDLQYTARERVLSMEELRRVWDAAGEAAYPFGNMVRLLILTAQRRSEVAELQRGWIDAKARTVTVPPSGYKTKRWHVYPLSPAAWELVDALPKWNGGEFLFSTTSGARPVSGFSKAKARLDTIIGKQGKKAGLPPMGDWTVHDLRRSVATHLPRLGVRPEHVGAVLGHVIVKGSDKNYNHHDYLDEKRAAIELWGRQWASASRKRG